MRSPLRRRPGKSDTWYRHVLPTAAVLFLAALAGACGSRGTATPAGKPLIVGTTTQIADIVRNIAGDRAAVVSLVGPNRDPHDYEPTTDAVEQVARSRVVFKNGAGLDDWLDRVLKNAGGSRPTVDLSAVVHLRYDAGQPDPHYWMDPTNVERMVPAIRDALVAADPADATAYRANANRYLQQVRTMDAQVKSIFDTVPTAGRKLVTDHDAFHYFADHFGLDYVGTILRGLSTSSEPTTQQLAALVGAIRDQGVKAIFAEASLNPKLAEQIGRDAGVKVVTDLYGDSLGPPGSDAGTYIGMMVSNARAIAEALR